MVIRAPMLGSTPKSSFSLKVFFFFRQYVLVNLFLPQTPLRSSIPPFLPNFKFPVSVSHKKQKVKIKTYKQETH